MEKTATIKKRNRASLEEGLDGRDQWTPGKEGKEGKETGSKRKQTEASEELEDDVPGAPHSWMAGTAADDESSSESEDDARQKLSSARKSSKTKKTPTTTPSVSDLLTAIVKAKGLGYPIAVIGYTRMLAPGREFCFQHSLDRRRGQAHRPNAHAVRACARPLGGGSRPDGRARHVYRSQSLGPQHAWTAT